jgi:hypothetical protein
MDLTDQLSLRSSTTLRIEVPSGPLHVSQLSAVVDERVRYGHVRFQSAVTALQGQTIASYRGTSSGA